MLRSSKRLARGSLVWLVLQLSNVSQFEGIINKAVVTGKLREFNNKTVVAVKMGKSDVGIEDIRAMLAEADLMKKFSDPPHRNVRLSINSIDFSPLQVVRLLGVCTQDRPIMVIMEYMANGSLVNVLREYCPTTEGVLELLPFEMSRMGLDVACGMEFLAEKGFVHRDLAARWVRSLLLSKPIMHCSNCLVDHDLNVKVSDFGMSRELHENSLILTL